MTRNLEERCDRIPRLGVTDIPMEGSPAVARTKRRGPLPILKSVDRNTDRAQTAEDLQGRVMMGAEGGYRSGRGGHVRAFESGPTLRTAERPHNPGPAIRVVW